jgi:choline kinase
MTHAVILAAGQGKRLAEFNPEGLPKCLLTFQGRSLLERQLEALLGLGVQHVTLVVGFKADLVRAHVDSLARRPEISFLHNPAYKRGSVLSLHAAQDVMMSGESTLVLDADVLFHPKIMKALTESEHDNCFLIDRDFEPGEEPVKIAIHRGRMVEFRKALPEGLEFDTIGESVGFFKFSGEFAAEVARVCAQYDANGDLDAPHEEVLRDILLARPEAFACEDITGLPWIEVDFPVDVERAVKQILPRLHGTSMNSDQRDT